MSPPEDTNDAPRGFVRWYDRLYHDKDYSADVAFVKKVSGLSKDSRILEIGAGTGNHSLRLAAEAEHLVSCEIDLDFLSLLRRKTVDVENIQVFGKPVECIPEADFDVACALFYMLNYLPNHYALVSFLQQIHLKLKSGTLFAADVWHGDFFTDNPPHNAPRDKQGTGWQATIKTQTLLSRDKRRAKMNQDFIVQEDQGPALHFREDYDLSLWRRADLIAAATEAGFRNTTFQTKATGKKALEASPFLWFVAYK